MERNLKDYVILDGVYFKEEQILKMAKLAGSFAVAEHYLCAYLAHSLLYGKKENIERVNEVRDIYNAPAIPLPEEDYAPRDEYGRSRTDSVETKVRKLYNNLTDSRRVEIMKSCLILLRSDNKLFCHKKDWLGILLVVRDRLDCSINQNNFLSFAMQITPDGWPESLRISKYTTTNFSKMLSNCEWTDAYYDMTDNPLCRLCDRFWEIVKQEILTEFQ